MIQAKNLCCNLIAADFTRQYRDGLKLRVGLRYDFHIVSRAYHCITLQAQNGAQHFKGLCFSHRLFGDKIDRAFDARIDDEGVTGVMADSSYYGLDICANKIQCRPIRGRVLRSGR